MRKLSVAELEAHHRGPTFTSVLPGHVVQKGGFRVYAEPNFRTHDGEPGRHTHTVPEIFVIVQGDGDVEVEGEVVDKFTAGEAVLFEPGEDHHLISRGSQPLVFVWMHLEPVS
ncbi:cupin domain-containing protein [Actinoplanes sp. NPDC051861]|uniref:cupin domain-containing protein n=1 Tax=Actinoplanes sp. NPDC051861 TaxID=3155170 RepID=UPI00343AC825